MKKALAIILTVILCVALGTGAWFTYSYLNDQKAEAEKQSEYSILVEDNVSINSDESYTLNPYLIKTDGTVSTPRFQYSSSSDCVAIDQNGTITVVNVPDTDDIIQITILDRNSGETAVVNLTILRSLSNVKDLTFINAKGERKLLPDELAVTWKDSFALDVYTQPQNINVKNYATVTITDLQGKAVDGVISHTFNSNCINLTAVGIGKGYINVVINDDSDEVLFSKQIAFSISTKEKYIGNALLAQQNSTVLTETALNNVTTFFLKETVGDVSELYCLEALDTIYLDLKRCFVPSTIISDYCYRVPVGLFYTYTSNAAWNSYVGSIIPFETYNDRFVVYHNEKGTTSQTELFYDKIDDDFALYTCQYTGCVNTGWNDQTATVTQEDVSAIAKNGVHLYAEWRQSEYTVEFVSDEKYGMTAIESEVLEYDQDCTLPTADGIGYNFKHWYVDINENGVFDDGDIKYDAAQTVNKLTATDNGLITFVACWSPIKYTVEFVSDEKYGMTAIKPVTLNYNAEPYSLPTATGYGYTFQFWYIDANGNHSFDEGETQFEQNVQNLSSTNSDVVKLSASWAENSYTILFDPVGTLSKDLQSDVILPADFQSAVTLKFSETYTLKRLEKEGYAYRWFIDTDGERTFNAEEPVSKLAHTHEDSITIKAKWTPISYTIAFDSADEYNMDPMDSISANYDEEYILKEPKAEGYTFVEWKLSEGDVKKAGDTVKNLTKTAGATVTLQAIWTENTYTIKFNVQDDVTTPEGFEYSVELKYSQKYTLPALSKTGYSYNWFVDENGNGVVDSNETRYNATVPVSKLIGSGEITLTSRWTPISYTLQFASSDSRYGMTAISSVTLNYDQEYTLPVAAGVGYTFEYWTYNGKEYNKEQLISKLTTEDGSTVTMTANWKVNTYEVKFEATAAKITLTKADGQKVSSGDSVEYGTSLTVSVTYEKDENKSVKVYKTGDANAIITKTNNSTFTMPAYGITVYAYSDSCVATGTLITLADGSQVAVENLTGNEMLLVWNLMTGTFDSAPILFVDSDPTAEYEIINLHFSDGTVVKVIDEHGFYDCDLNEYVFLRSDAQKYVGHHFNKQITDTDGNVAWTTVELTDVVVTKERTEAWSPVTYGHLCLYVNGMLSMPGATTGFINIFEVDSSTLQIDYDKYLADIEEYGLFTYEEFCETFDVSEEIFNAFNGQYLKVSIGKGLITYDEIEALIVRYSKFF